MKTKVEEQRINLNDLLKKAKDKKKQIGLDAKDKIQRSRAKFAQSMLDLQKKKPTLGGDIKTSGMRKKFKIKN